MNLEQLLPNIKQWSDSINSRTSVTDEAAVYAICTSDSFPRLRGNSSVVYIGSSLRLGGRSDGSRLYSYRYSPQPHSKKIRDGVAALEQDGYSVHLRWLQMKTEQEAREFESKLLAQHREEHLEYPPFNGKA